MQFRTKILKSINNQVFIFIMALFTITAQAQMNKIDGVDVVIGKNVVLSSDIAKFKLDIEQRSEGKIKISDCEMLEQLMLQKLLSHHAVIDSVLVTETEVNLSRQGAGSERFGSSMLSRTIVRAAMDISNAVEKITPKKLQKRINKRFDDSDYQKKLKNMKDAPSFDMVRASVNLTVASILISFATSLKLPLSTTYVTFMVAMGSSLADKAWGRESAVYRITGVITVIGGWFMTAFTAFTVAFIIALIISWGGAIAIAAFVIIALYTVIRTHASFNKKEADKKKIKRLADEDLHTNKIGRAHV